MHISFRFLLLVLTFAVLSLPSVTFAEAWTIQTVALRDYRVATQRVARLRSLGFNAYTEFAMSNGQQFVRIRVGCFTDRSIAESVAVGLKEYVTEEAVVVPLSDDAVVQPCVLHDVGFRLPDAWGVMASEPGGVIFWAEVGDRRGYIAFNGRHWHVIQTEAEAKALQGSSWVASYGAPVSPMLAAATAGSIPARFVHWPKGGFLQAVTPEGQRLMVGEGEVLWQSDSAIVLQTADAVVAVYLVSDPR